MAEKSDKPSQATSSDASGNITISHEIYEFSEFKGIKMIKSKLNLLFVLTGLLFGTAAHAGEFDIYSVPCANDQEKNTDPENPQRLRLTPLDVMNKHFSYNEKMGCWASIAGTGIRTAEMACIKPVHKKCVKTSDGTELYLLAVGPYMKYDTFQPSEYNHTNYKDEVSKLPKYAVHMFVVPVEKWTNHIPIRKTQHFVDTLQGGVDGPKMDWQFAQFGKDIYGYYGQANSNYFQWSKGDYIIMMPFGGRIIKTRIPAWTRIDNDCANSDVPCSHTDWTTSLKVNKDFPEHNVYPIEISASGVYDNRAVMNKSIVDTVAFQKKLDRIVGKTILKKQGVVFDEPKLPENKPFLWVFDPDKKRYIRPKGFPGRNFSGN